MVQGFQHLLAEQAFGTRFQGGKPSGNRLCSRYKGAFRAACPSAAAARGPAALHAPLQRLQRASEVLHAPVQPLLRGIPRCMPLGKRCKGIFRAECPSAGAAKTPAIPNSAPKPPPESLPHCMPPCSACRGVGNAAYHLAGAAKTHVFPNRPAEALQRPFRAPSARRTARARVDHVGSGSVRTTDAEYGASQPRRGFHGREEGRGTADLELALEDFAAARGEERVEVRAAVIGSRRRQEAGILSLVLI